MALTGGVNSNNAAGSGNGSGQTSHEKVSTISPALTSRTSTDPPGLVRVDTGLNARKYNTEIPEILPHEKVFPVQVGSELFKLSGASISSDAPSYFSQYFLCQLKQAEFDGDKSGAVRTLYIDRDPFIFKDILLHLQGYHIRPRNPVHFVKLFTDTLAYSLPRLTSQMYEEDIFITIGTRDFQISRELFAEPGNSPNFFTVSFAMLFTSPGEMFPGLDKDGLLRPPSINPLAVAIQSPDTFEEILQLLRGYPLHIRNEEHRSELLRDCRYFHLRGLEQKLIHHQISFNLIRRRQEISIRLEDVRQSGISVTWDAAITDVTEPHSQSPTLGWVQYARPFVHDNPYELVLEIGEECTRINLQTMRAEFFGDVNSRISKLFEVIATKLNLPITQPLGLLMAKGGASSQPASPGNSAISDDQVRIILGSEAAICVDGEHWPVPGVTGTAGSRANLAKGSGIDSSSVSDAGPPPNKKQRTETSMGRGETWIVKKGQWRLLLQHAHNVKGGLECLLVAVKLDAVTGEQGRNAQRPFLS